jgi:hypothetical protein
MSWVDFGELSRYFVLDAWRAGYRSTRVSKAGQRFLAGGGTPWQRVCAVTFVAKAQQDLGKQNALGTPSPHPSIFVRDSGSTPYQDRSHQVYPKPQVEPLMRMNKDQHQDPGKTSPQHGSPGLRDKEPPHVDPSDKQRKPGQKQASNKEPDRDPVRQRQYRHWHVLAPGETRGQDTYQSNCSCSANASCRPGFYQAVRLRVS